MTAADFRRIASAFLLVFTLALTSCRSPEDGDVSAPDTQQPADTPATVQQEEPFTFTLLSENREPVRYEVPVAPPPPGIECPVPSNPGENDKQVDTRPDTVSIDPPSRRKAVAAIDAGADRMYNLRELPTAQPQVLLTENGGGPSGPPRPLRLTLSAAGCTWRVGALLSLAEFVEGEWVVRATADFPEQWTVTAELESLNSRFALGTW